jgi:AcrR family transcriptional regulator
VSAPGRQNAAAASDRPRRRRLTAASRRETILDAAIPLFATTGYEQTRMSDVAARVGVTEPVIFQNFGTKAELFAAALERVSRDAASYLSQLAEECATVDDWLRRLLAADHLDHLHTAPMFGVLLADAHQLHSDASIAGALHRCVARVAEAMTGILRRGQTEGSIRADTSPDTLAWFVVSLIHARQFWRVHATDASTAFEDDLLASVLSAIRPRAPGRV